jgi:hypothetical protein
MNPKRFHYNTSLLAMDRYQPNARGKAGSNHTPWIRGYLEVNHGYVMVNVRFKHPYCL